ncbi:MAG: FAD-dependent oxidoreductase [Leptospira sp.]|nr:FAD-dependent oxidoreductase [Leptospira sp.]
MPDTYKLPKTIVIIGAALAGPVAASRAREIDSTARIVLIERNTRVSYAMAGLSFHLSGEVPDLENLNREREDYFKNIYNIEVYTKTEVNRIEPKTNTLYLTSPDGLNELVYDKLIFATGASSIHPDGLHKEYKNYRYFRTLDDLAHIQNQIKSGNKRILVLGGGSMGLEAVDGCVRGGASVILVEKETSILPQFSENISKLAESGLNQKIKIFTGVNLIKFRATNDLVTDVIIDGIQVSIDYIISAIGVKPRTEILKNSGVKLHKDGTIKINRHCQTNIKNIYACSICVSVPSIYGDLWIPQAAVSDKTAQVAGANAAGKKVKLENFTASMILRLACDKEVGRTGLTWKQSMETYNKNKVDKVLVHGNDKESYFPGSEKITLELIYHKKNHRLLGIDMIGKNIKSRLDAGSIAIAKKMTLSELANMDFAYSPAFGTSRDVLNIAAIVALQKIDHLTDMLDPKELIQNREKYFLLDVGGNERFNMGSDFWLPLESIRTNMPELLQKLNFSRATQIALISETGRRGHLAYQILKDHHIPAINVSGGYRLLSVYLEKQ